jgi:hypothetical protein
MDSPTQPVPEPENNDGEGISITIEQPPQYHYKFFYDSLITEQIPREDGRIDTPGVMTITMYDSWTNPYTYNPSDMINPDSIARDLWAERYDRYSDTLKIDTLRLYGECFYSAPFIINDENFVEWIDWGWVCPNYDI